MVAKTVYLESIDLSVFGMIVNSIFFQGCLHFICQSLTFVGQSGLFIYRCQNLGCLTKRRHGKEIRRNQILQCSSIIRRTESRNNQSDRFHRVTQSVVSHRVECTLCLTLELIRAYTVFTLLFFKSTQYIGNRLYPFFIEDTGITCCLPVLISQTQGIAE